MPAELRDDDDDAEVMFQRELEALSSDESEKLAEEFVRNRPFCKKKEERHCNVYTRDISAPTWSRLRVWCARRRTA